MTETISYFGTIVPKEASYSNVRGVLHGRYIYFPAVPSGTNFTFPLPGITVLNYDTKAISHFYNDSVYMPYSSPDGDSGQGWNWTNTRDDIVKMEVVGNLLYVEYTTQTSPWHIDAYPEETKITVYNLASNHNAIGWSGPPNQNYATPMAKSGSTIYFVPGREGDPYLGSGVSVSGPGYVCTTATTGLDGCIYSMSYIQPPEGELPYLMVISKYNPVTHVITTFDQVGQPFNYYDNFVYKDTIYSWQFRRLLKINTTSGTITDSLVQVPDNSAFNSPVVRGDFAYTIAGSYSTTAGSYILKFDIVNETFTTLGRAPVGGSWGAGVLASNGSLYFPPTGTTTDFLKIAFGSEGTDDTNGSNPTDYGDEPRDPPNSPVISPTGNIFVYDVHYEVGAL